MTYLEDFQRQISNRDFSKFLQLWEEYCTSDTVDSEEFIQILKSVKGSELSKSFSKLIESALPIWQMIADKEASYNVLKLLIDIQTTNTPELAELCLKAIQERYGQDPKMNERLRLVGLRTRDQFQGALTHYDLLAHMEQGHFLFHPGGWGTGEIIEVSPIRQQVTIEFENVSGRKHITFDNAFKSLMPLRDDHIMARRFADPDLLEKEARQDPVAVVKALLRDLGPKTAAEIKDALCELVIPEADWAKWWGGARAKLKKDSMVESPEALRDPFRLRQAELSQTERLNKAIQDKTDINEMIQAAYNFLRDLPNARKNQEVKNALRDKLLEQYAQTQLTPEQELQVCICLESQFGHEIPERQTKQLIQKMENIEEAIQSIDIVALKKRALVLVRENRKDWVNLFLKFLDSVKHSALRDYLVKELNQGESRQKLEAAIEKLISHPEHSADFFVWYFQKILNADEEKLPFADKEGQYRLFEGFLVLLSRLENKPEQREQAKKMYALLAAKRYAVVRAIMDGASLEFVKEFLLLASKCQTFTDHDIKILHSLAAVVHPSLSKKGEVKEEEDQTLWTTEESYQRVQEQIKHIGTVEIVETAREIEAARALGDLRENSEYKYAQEKRHRLQGQMKRLSEQLKNARIITKDDIIPDEVGIGMIVELANGKGQGVAYTILGPWEADPERNVLSFQSQLAKTMWGCKKGDTFQFRDEKMTVKGIRSIFEK